jgi:peptide/nickel transport system substrate-binding protein
MRFTKVVAGIVLGIVVSAAPALAQSTLRIGLAEDPDNLDPTTAGSYVGHIVLGGLCDKLFDIDEDLKVVPQLALFHETSADGKTVTIKLRPGVNFTMASRSTRRPRNSRSTDV